MDITVAVSSVSSAECETRGCGIQQSSADSEQTRRHAVVALLLGTPRTCGCVARLAGTPLFSVCFQDGFMQLRLPDATVMASMQIRDTWHWRSRIRLYLRRC
jgi:hypothetical protein